MSLIKEEDIYLQNFWNPSIGNQVVYEDNLFRILDISNGQAILEGLSGKIIWLQDLKWKPTLEDCDNIAGKFNAEIIGNQILFKNKEGKRCFFERPSNVSDYRDLIRQLRILNNFKEVH